MSTFTNRYIVYAISLFTMACVTPTTDSIENFVDAQKSGSITLSLEDSRTQLGNQEDNRYALYWSEGDKISVNGIESEEAIIDLSNPARATFNFNKDFEGSCNIAYPAAPEGQVIFAENQTHANNTTFGRGVAAMYGTNIGSTIQLKHLTGILKIGIVGTATLKKACISTTSNPLAGLFNINFESGAITPTTGSKYAINYTFGNGVQLDASHPTYLHVAIPAGEYDSISVMLYDNEGGTMIANIAAPSHKPIVAGVVREFSENIIYAPSNVEAEVGRTLPSWEEGYLDIHYINTARGECAFYILPDGTTMVVDVGELSVSYGSYPITQRPNIHIRPYITYSNYIKHFMPKGKSELDYCQISHFHIDHFGDQRIEAEVNPIGYRKIGALALYDEIPFKNILDRAYPDYVEDSKTPDIDDDKLIEDWKMLIRWGEANGKIKAARFTPGKEQIVLVNNREKYSNFKILNVCANGYVYRKNTAGNPGVFDGTTDCGNPTSCGFHLRYGDFDHLSCGDLASGPQNRVALYFRDFIGEGHLDTFKGHHHLSENSWGSGMRNNNFNPQVVVNQNFYKKQPDSALLTNYIFPKVNDLFTTNAHPEALVENPGTYAQMAGYNGHIVVRVKPGGGSFNVYMLDDSNFEYRVKSIHGPYTSK